MSEGKYLVHYASPYYDPVKAHEYYMQHRKLKGRQVSTKGMGTEQKKAFVYANSNIQKAKKQEIKEGVAGLRKENDKLVKERTDAFKRELTARGKYMSKWQKQKLRMRLNRRISELRASLASDSSRLSGQISDKYLNIAQNEANNIKKYIAGDPKKSKSSKKSSSSKKKKTKTTKATPTPVSSSSRSSSSSSASSYSNTSNRSSIYNNISRNRYLAIKKKKTNGR